MLKKKKILCSHKTYKNNHSAENRIKNYCSFKNYISLFNVEAFFVHELPLLFVKRLSITLHYSVMILIILAFINTFQIFKY